MTAVSVRLLRSDSISNLDSLLMRNSEKRGCPPSLRLKIFEMFGARYLPNFGTQTLILIILMMPACSTDLQIFIEIGQGLVYSELLEIKTLFQNFEFLHARTGSPIAPIWGAKNERHR